MTDWITLPNGTRRRPAACHPDRPVTAKGKCSECYHLETWPAIRDRKNAQKLAKRIAAAAAEGREFKPRPDKLPPRACKTCGKGTPAQAKAYCSDECKASKPASFTRICTECLRPMPGGRTSKTCSDDCAKALWVRKVKVAPPDGAKGTVRSASKRASRAKQKSRAYKRADKADVIARLMTEQAGLCVSCGLDGGDRGLVLDHDHKTGEPRCLLCAKCNAAFGLLDESPEKILGLLEYARACIEDGLSKCA